MLHKTLVNKLKKVGLEVTCDGHKYYACGGYNQATWFKDSQTEHVNSVYVKPKGAKDQPESDYYSGSWIDTAVKVVEYLMNRRRKEGQPTDQIWRHSVRDGDFVGSWLTDNNKAWRVAVIELVSFVEKGQMTYYIGKGDWYLQGAEITNKTGKAIAEDVLREEVPISVLLDWIKENEPERALLLGLEL